MNGFYIFKTDEEDLKDKNQINEINQEINQKVLNQLFNTKWMTVKMGCQCQCNYQRWRRG